MDACSLHVGGAYLLGGTEVVPAGEAPAFDVVATPSEAARGTMAHSILAAHNTSPDMAQLRLRFDMMASPENNSVNILQSAKASGLERFAVPYVLSNCHNTLAAVGGTINEDDHAFVRSAAERYGGIFVPPHVAVIHQYMRETMARSRAMALVSDSHARYGALGCMGVGEGGGELVKQLLGNTYDLAYPEVVAIYLEGAPAPGVGPHDVALALVRALYASGYAKNKVLEFVGPGVSSLSVDARLCIDAMTAETTCLSSVWVCDERVRGWYETHGRAQDFAELAPEPVAYYDGCLRIDLGRVRPMIALPFHPSNAVAIEELNDNLDELLHEVEEASARVAGASSGLHLREHVADGRLLVQQGVIGGCTGGCFTNLYNAAKALRGRSCGAGEFTLSCYPASQAVNLELMRCGSALELMRAGAIMRTAMCGPCFGAGDTPRNGGLSVRHVTRNFVGREGCNPGRGQFAAVALMDARSIAATAANGGRLTAATELDVAWDEEPSYHFDASAYEKRVYVGWGKAEPARELVYGPNIKDWPEMEPLANDALLKVCAKLMDPVTTTDELVPSGEASAFRSNPIGLAEFTLCERDPGYVARAKQAQAAEARRMAGESLSEVAPEVSSALEALERAGIVVDARGTEYGSVLYAVKPGDGSSREQAASCQRVLGGIANIATDYATKRYRSNLINWGMLPLVLEGEPPFELGDHVYLPRIREALDGELSRIDAWVVRADGSVEALALSMAALGADERAIIKAGCLINHNRASM